jgi:hypothetical protein
VQRLQPVEIVGSALRMAGCGEDRTAVMLEDFELDGDVGPRDLIASEHLR